MDSVSTEEVSGPEAVLAGRIALAGPAPDHDAEAALYRLMAPRVRRYGLRHLRDGHAANDLMQHVMALTIEQLRAGAVREPGRVVSFVFGTCRRVVAQMRRGEQRREGLLERHADALAIADIAVAPRLDEERVVRCLERLPERERSVLVMSFYEEQAADDVAAALGLSAGNVRVIRHRGIARLRGCVEGAGRVVQ
jgi:RNA polymerase sigma-70 factor (ECF subfamily)